jgi:hypothetical protein
MASGKPGAVQNRRRRLPSDGHGHEHRCLLVPAQTALPSLASPREQQALSDPVPAGHRTDRHAGLVRGFDDPRFVLERPAPPSFDPLQYLDPHHPDPLTLTPALRSGFSRARDAFERGLHRRRTVLRAWGVKLAGRQGNKRATVALARKIAVVMHRMWVDGTTFRFSAAGNPSASARA